MASADQRAQIASRAAILANWKGEISHAVVTQTLESEKAKILKELRGERNQDQKTYLQGYLDALDLALAIPERSFIEHQRQLETA